MSTAPLPRARPAHERRPRRTCGREARGAAECWASKPELAVNGSRKMKRTALLSKGRPSRFSVSRSDQTSSAQSLNSLPQPAAVSATQVWQSTLMSSCAQTLSPQASMHAPAHTQSTNALYRSVDMPSQMVTAGTVMNSAQPAHAPPAVVGRARRDSAHARRAGRGRLASALRGGRARTLSPTCRCRRAAAPRARRDARRVTRRLGAAAPTGPAARRVGSADRRCGEPRGSLARRATRHREGVRLSAGGAAHPGEHRVLVGR